MTKRNRDYNGYDDESDTLRSGESYSKANRSGYSYEHHSRRHQVVAEVGLIEDNPFYRLQRHLYILTEQKKKFNSINSPDAQFRKEVKELFNSFEYAVLSFEDWIKKREHIDGGKHIINKTISFIFLNLGQLLEFTDVSLSANKLALIIRELEQPTLQTPTLISRAFYGLGTIADANRLNGKIPTALIENLLNQLLQFPRLTDQELSSCITGLGSLASGLDTPIKTELIHQLLMRVNSNTSENRESIIRITTLLSRMSREDKLTTPIDSALIQSLIEKFYNVPDLTETNHHKMLTGLEWFIYSKKFHGDFDAHIIPKLLEYGLSRDRSLYLNLGFSILQQLTQGNHLRGAIDFSLIINKFNKRTPDIGYISELIYITGILAQKGHLKALSPQVVQELIDTLSKVTCHDERHVGDIFTGLGLLIQTQHVNINQINQLNGCLAPLLNELPLQKRSPVNAEKILFGLVELRTKMRCNDEQLHQIIHSALASKNPMAPRELIRYIDWFTKLSQVYPIAPLNHSFENLLSSIHFQVNTLNTEERERFDRMLLALPNRTWAKSLSIKLGMPTVQTRPAPLHRDEDVPMQESNTSQQKTSQVRSSPPTRTILPVRGAPVRMPIQRTETTTEQRQSSVLSAPIQHTQRTRTESRSLQLRPSQSNSSDRPESWNTAYRSNALFKAIADRNMHQLSVLLGVNFPIRTHVNSGQSTSSSTGNNHRGNHSQVERDDHHVANAAVTQLLEKTQPNALRILITQANAAYFELLLRACSNHTRYQLAQKNALRPIMLYLPIQELERYIPNLLGLEFYRDSTALVKLVNALKTRATEHPEELERIKQLQIQLLDRAIEFHTRLHHPNVLSILRTEKALTLRMTANTNQSSLTQIPQRMFAPQPQRVVQPQRLVINRRYHYETEDMNRILLLRLRNLNLSEENTPSLSVLSAANMSDGTQGNRVLDILNQYFAGNEGQLVINSQIEHNLIIPIVHNNHWVGIRIHLKPGESPQITYYNTVSNYEYDDELQVSILLEVNRALLNHTSWTQPSIRHHDKTLIQDDASSCGPLLIESIYCHLTNRSWRQTNPPELLAEKIRRQQLKLLEEKDPQFYHRFYTHQAEQSEQNNTMKMS
ncbi:hypothetical protein J2N86_08880 [Legionella lytica]|uniref:Ubiquitin-like protease family profile domain-containing protein n=1 Tax=Legionella lytica TaxID=96232 RepID=A0ABY4Y5D1_9GAMM|nr:Ulp1 family isopeptidase [Legionella lytica]USQ12821.1 hypothetical protein J2N86_08880 [Legionella lytica]